MQHQAPAFIDDPHAPEGVPPMQGLSWYGHMRFVHRQRARTLRKKGVPLRVYGAGLWVWYETDASYDERKMRRQLSGWLRSNSADRLFCKSLASMLSTNFADVEARVRTLFEIRTATGRDLDQLCRIPYRPQGMTDVEVRSLYRNGYMLTVGELQSEGRALRQSPPMTLYYFDEAQHLPTEGWPTDKPFETGPFPLGVLHVKPEGEE